MGQIMAWGYFTISKSEGVKFMFFSEFCLCMMKYRSSEATKLKNY